MAPRQMIPAIRDVDLIVVGGSSGGVAAAAAAARAGARVFLGAAETYLGEDICATGQLWLPTETPLDTPLARALFAAADGTRTMPVRPLDIKRRLDDELIEAGVPFLFGCAPADLLVDRAGRVAGVVFASKSGQFAVRGSVIIDATPGAQLARLADVPFTAWAGGTVKVRHVTIGHWAAGDAGSHGCLLPGRVRGEVDGKTVELEAFEYAFDLPLAAWSAAAMAELEQVVRDRLWHPDQTWTADRSWCVPPTAVDTGRLHAWQAPDGLALDAFETTRPNLFVLGPCAAVTRDAAARLLLAPVAIACGERLGRHAAATKTRLPATALPLHGTASEAGVREPCTCGRFLRESKARLRGPAGANLPELGAFDVVVVGGGTGGAPAAIAAARTGARVLLLEALHGLGGVGTLGCISIYYYGYREGFTAEVTAGLRKLSGDPNFDPARWNNLHKAEWFRAELRKAGGQIWFGAIVSGAVVDGRRVRGVVVNTPWGRGLVRAGAVIDATGNADVAAAAGAPCRIVSDAELAVQGTGLPSLPLRPTYHNTDYTFVEDDDLVDSTRAFVVARRKFAGAFDLAQIVDSRERRQIVGDVTVTPLDAYTGRTWRDTICLSHSNFDSHGFTVHPIFLVEPPDHTSLNAWLPLRALLPKSLDGLLVTGLALSGQRDVMPVLRMQPDIQNHAYAAGLAAVAAARHHAGNLRAIDIRGLQRTLAACKILPQVALLHEDGRPPAATVIASAAGGDLHVHAEVAALLARPAVTRPLLRARLAVETDGAARMQLAKLLAALDDATGASVFTDALAAVSGWDAGWNYTGMGQYGRSLSPLDDCIVCLARLRTATARPAVLEKAAALDATQAFSHFRAVALFCEALPDAACAATLADLLAKPGIAGHAWTTLAHELADIPASSTDTRTRNEALRELYLARALFRCGDREGLAAQILGAYSRDIRGHFARHASGVLAQR